MRAGVYCVVLAVAGASWAGGTNDRVHLGASALSPTGDMSNIRSFDAGDAQLLGLSLDVEPRPAWGYTLGYERTVSARVGVDADLTFGSFDLRAATGVSGEESRLALFPELAALDGQTARLGQVDARLLTVGAQLYIWRGAAVEVSLSPRIGMAWFDDITIDDATRTIWEDTGFLAGLEESLTLDDGLVVGAEVGARVPLGTPRLALATGLRYLAFSGDFEDDAPEGFAGETLDFNPIVFEAALEYRF